MIRHAAARHTIVESARMLLLIRGALAIAFGVTAMLWPGLTALILAYLFAVFLLADGSLVLITSFEWKGATAHMRLLSGLVQVLLGLFILYNPELSFAVLIIVLGVALLVRGAFSLGHALHHRVDPAQHRIMHAVQGGLGVIVGGVVAFQPAAGGLAFVWVLGLYALITGSLLVGLAVGSGAPRQHHHGHHEATA